MEDELQRLILDIHDGAVQKLYAAASHLALLQAQLSDAPSELVLIWSQFCSAQHCLLKVHCRIFAQHSTPSVKANSRIVAFQRYC
jgi:signal transduction histidine kinase